ncbi:MAG: putative sulfate exporter family transporter [Euryarchaeota archaeon]|nr:putative sulfate exporter family transporter [Euryarchaeota archaeon]
MSTGGSGNAAEIAKGATTGMLLALIAYAISYSYPSLDALFLALFFGMGARVILGAGFISREAIDWSVRFFIPAGIVLYSANIPFYVFRVTNPLRIVEILWVVFLYFALIMAMGSVLRMERRLTALLATGSAICGASAIAVVSPLIKARREEMSIAIMTITAVGLTGAMIYPILRDLLSIGDAAYSFLCGATLHQMGLVKIASSYAGEEVVSSALAFKGVRVSLIALAALAVPYLLERKPAFPLFIVGFLVLSFLFSFVEELRGVAVLVSPFATFAFSVAMASIGLSIDMQSLHRARLRYLNVSYAAWLLVVVFVLVTEGVIY